MVSQDLLSLISSVDDARSNYNNLRGLFVKKAAAAAIVFCEQYDQNIKNLDQLIDKVSDLALPHIMSAVDDAVKYLVVHKIFDVDADHFVDEYYQAYDCWDEAYDKVSDEYAEIVHKGEELDAYRTARRQNRSTIVGGGFGVGGALKGMAMAGTANMAIGAAHGAFNLAAKGINAVGEAIKKNGIFSDSETKSSLVDALFKSVLNVHLALLDALRKNSCPVSFRAPSLAEKEKASRMLNNIQQGRLTSHEGSAALSKLISLDPYLEESYKYAIKSFGDMNCEIERVAAFYHFDLRKVKENEIRKLIATKTEAEVEESLIKVKDAGKNLGYPVDNKFVPELEEKLRQFDVIARTVADKIYSTREAAQAAVAQLAQERKEKIDATVSSVKKGVRRTVKFAGYSALLFIVLVVVMIVFSEKPEKISLEASSLPASNPAGSDFAASQAPVIATSTVPPSTAPMAIETTAVSIPDTAIVVNNIDAMMESNDEAEIQRIVSVIEASSRPQMGGDKKVARQMNDQGLVALKAAKNAEAVRIFTEGVGIDPSDPELLNNLAYAQMENGNLTEALIYLNKTLMAAPRRASAWTNLATVYARTDRQKQAVSALLNAYRFSGNKKKMLDFLRKASQDQGSDPKFSEAARVALESPLLAN